MSVANSDQAMAVSLLAAAFAWKGMPISRRSAAVPRGSMGMARRRVGMDGRGIGGSRMSVAIAGDANVAKEPVNAGAAHRREALLGGR